MKRAWNSSARTTRAATHESTSRPAVHLFMRSSINADKSKSVKRTRRRTCLEVLSEDVLRGDVREHVAPDRPSIPDFLTQVIP